MHDATAIVAELDRLYCASVIRLRAMEKHHRDEQQALIATYCEALGLA